MAKAASHLLLALLLGGTLAGCAGQHDRVVLTGQEPWRDGDLVLRCGFGAESRAVTQASHSAYSHVGILLRDEADGRWLVIHAVPGEAERGELELLKCEPVEQYFAPDRAERGAWVRVRCTDSVAASAARYAMGKAQARVEFDNDYQLSDTTSLYCTELVWQAYLHQGIDLSDGQRHDVPLMVSGDGECIFPSDIEESEQVLYVKPLKTKQQ